MSTGTYSFDWTLAEEVVEEQLVDVPVVQQASPSRVELLIPVEISSSSPSAEAINSPEMNLPAQLEPTNSPRVPSPIGQAEITNPPEAADPTPFQPETHELPMAVSAPSSSEVSALLGAPSSPVIAPTQETSHEVTTRTNSGASVFNIPNSAMLFIRVRFHHHQACHQRAIQLPR
jgi:hypothetical protein